MKPLTTSIYTFANLIDGGFLYVDKTEAILDLIRPATAHYFLSRPRRFGKSLLISTLAAIFQGRKELFTGLALERSGYAWPVHPVIHLDLGSVQGHSVHELEDHLLRKVRFNAGQARITLDGPTCYTAFEELIQKLSARDGAVVILVDEYDKPLLGNLGKPEVGEIQRVLKAFYSIIKTTEPYQRFVLVTGVSKFSQVSIFSDLNNLTDLTLDSKAATLLGYTQAEIEANFPDYIEALAVSEGESLATILTRLRSWYNGYRFEEHATTVYNPVSVMKCLGNRKFGNYWFETGTPGFLIELLRRRPMTLDDLFVPETAFSAYDPENLEALPLLLQTGYLTIKKAEMQGIVRMYELGFPNLEIEVSFSTWLAQGFSDLPAAEMTSALSRIVAALEHGDVDTMLETLRLFFAKVPNTITIKNEKYWQTIFFTVFTLIGARIEAEVSTNIGRIDCVVKTARRIYIFEFKLNDSAESALEQIHRKRYAERWQDDGREIVTVGVSFGQKERNIEAWLVGGRVYGRFS